MVLEGQCCPLGRNIEVLALSMPDTHSKILNMSKKYIPLCKLSLYPDRKKLGMVSRLFINWCLHLEASVSVLNLLLDKIFLTSTHSLSTENLSLVPYWDPGTSCTSQHFINQPGGKLCMWCPCPHLEWRLFWRIELVLVRKIGICAPAVFSSHR